LALLPFPELSSSIALRGHLIIEDRDDAVLVPVRRAFGINAGAKRCPLHAVVERSCFRGVT
jgi:hypothetical protein